MTKKVNFGAKPTPTHNAIDIDRWVENRTIKMEKLPTKRLTIDMPVDLHKRIKLYCVTEDLMMVDVIRDLLLKQFPATSVE